MYIKHFKDVGKRDIGIAGGKGASLGEMTRVGIPVPPGFVVVAGAFDRFLQETDIDVEIESVLHGVNHQDVNSVDRASNIIRSLIENASFPDDLGREILASFGHLQAQHVAVRSSATAEDSSVASWAGELESYLYVEREGLLAAVRQCWSSLFTPRAIFYRFEKKLYTTRVSVAVVVQKMVASEVSGICFTVHPVTEDRDQMILEAGWGLGEAIVGGMITPDSYVVRKGDWKILDINVNEQTTMVVHQGKGTGKMEVPRLKISKQKLSQEKILELAKLCQRIENHYGHPQDIEWAFENGRIFVLQSRPITTLK